MPGITETDLTKDSRWQLVQRVTASRAFAGSAPLRDFLVFIAENALLGKSEEIKEQAIGSSVLRRSADFDPAIDNIVRVRARQLRQKLDLFFNEEGREEPIVITVPRGGYIPVFGSRGNAPAEVPIARATYGPALTPDPPLVLVSDTNKWWPWAISCVLAIVSLGLWIALEREAAAGKQLSPDSRILWSQLFPQGGNALVVLSDPDFGLWQLLAHKDILLRDYANMRFGIYADQFTNVPSELLGSTHISLSAAHFLVDVVPISEALHSGLKLRPAQQTNLNDFKSGNVILLGGRRSNPWAELFEPKLHYVTAKLDSHSKSHFNTRALAEKDGIIAAGDGESYAVIALLPNLTGTGKILMIEGLTMEGTDAACEFLVNPKSSSLLVHRLKTELGSATKPFEALLRLAPISGGSINIELVSLHAPLP
jgi:hypothetical protein